MSDPLETIRRLRDLCDEVDRLQGSDSVRAEWTQVRDSLVMAALYEIPQALAFLAESEAREKTLRETLESADEFLDTVTEFKGASGEELAEEQDAIRAALAAVPSPSDSADTAA